MNYETAMQMAQRLGVTVRTVQLWAKNGRLPGAIKQGRDYLIPTGLEKPDKNGFAKSFERAPLTLINSEVMSGKYGEYVESIADNGIKKLAQAEYYYFTGQVKLAVEATELFFNNEDIITKLSACLIYSFSHLSLGNTHLAELGLNCIRESIRIEVDKDATPQYKAACVLLDTAAAVLMHDKSPEEKLIEHVKYLPRGLQLWAFYVLSHEAFLNEDYNRALGMAETCLAIPVISFPLSIIYLNLAAAMNFMALKRVDEAKKHFFKAWDLAQQDGFLQIFAEHNGLLCGLVETCLKSDYPQSYRVITNLSINFAEGWRKVHNNRTRDAVTDSLTTTEFAICMLAGRSWTNSEIAEYMNLSVHTVKRYISIAYQKLGIANRNELKAFIH